MVGLNFEYDMSIDLDIYQLLSITREVNPNFMILLVLPQTPRYSLP
jgi:hypothetical protein